MSEIENKTTLLSNQTFKKLCRVYILLHELDDDLTSELTIDEMNDNDGIYTAVITALEEIYDARRLAISKHRKQRSY